MNKFIGYILSIVHYLVFFLILVIFQPIQWLSLKLGGYSAHKNSVDILNFFLVSSYYLLGCRVTFHNKQQLPTDRPLIFVANHQSMYDIPPLIWFLRKYHAKFISKIELTKGIPSISFNLKYGGGANIDRKDTKQSIVEIAGLGTRMKKNTWSAVIFPEGTRSKTGKMKAFQVGGIATLYKKASNALIVPIAIENAWKLNKYGKFPLSPFNHLIFTVLPPINPDGKNMEEVVLYTENEIKKIVEKD
ncbi:1-acyl-sn-glycerol-3-phosphate acyltransferase [Pseudoxanthomonas sp. SGD-10]|nr:1-acyl-sn-glycerol-3-phosphate acyltransferase [Pseudoxanthomonas sp. SGD-10]